MLRTLAAIAACSVFFAGAASAVGPALVTVPRNHPAELAQLGPTVPADPAMNLHLTIVLGIHDRAKLHQLLADQQNPSSADYHRWLTPEQFNQRFGPTQAQTDALVQWFKDKGFEVNVVNRLGRTIEVSATVAQVEAAFSTTIVTSGASYGNTTDPSVPAEFAGLIVNIQGLDNMHAAVPAGLRRRSSAGEVPLHEPLLALADIADPEAGGGDMTVPGVTYGGTTAFGPFDIETFYDEAPLIVAGNRGTHSPDCIALDEDSDYLDAAVSLFASAFGFNPFTISRVLPSGSSPGRNGDEIEALLDIDYAHATAPATPIYVYVDGDLYASIQSSVTDNVCGAISISFGYCSSSTSFFTGLDTLFAQAASQGQSVFVSSGDWGAAGLQYDASTNSCVIGTTRTVNEMAASPHVTAVGGTTFDPRFNSSGNDTSEVGVAPGGIETGWDGSGGGASEVFAKPAWQSGPGVPNDSTRDVPDVAIIAWLPGVFVGADAGGAAQIQCCWGGTSLSAPLWAGYSRAIARQEHQPRLGLINPRLYSLAQAGLSTNGIEDVTSGNNSYNGVTGYNAHAGYDRVTGWGSVDMATFAYAYSGTTPPTPTPKPTPTPTPTPIPTPTPEPTPAPLHLSSTSVSFGAVQAGHSSAQQSIRLSNPTGSTATITSANLLTGSDFTIVGSSCDTPLATGQSCFVEVKFSPQSAGVKADTLQFVDSAPNSPQNVTLRGTATDRRQQYYWPTQ